MMTYSEYIFGEHVKKIKENALYIKDIPADELTYEICCVAVKQAAGDCDFFKWILANYPQFVDESLCKNAVSAEPKKKFVQSIPGIEDPDGYVNYRDQYRYFEPVLKYVPKQFLTPDVCRESAKYDWRTLEFVPKEIQLSCPDICEIVANNWRNVMYDDIEYYQSGDKREKEIFKWLDKSVFKLHPTILKGEYTLKYVSEKWILDNPDKIGQLLLKHPDQVKLLPKDLRTKLIDVIRSVAEKNSTILYYLSESEQKAMPEVCESALKNGFDLRSIHPSVQLLMPETCVNKLTDDPNERGWLSKGWAHKPTPGLNLQGLCTKLQNKNSELISKLVSEQVELLEYVKPSVLIAHPEICVAAIEKDGELAFRKIPQVVFDKRPELYNILLKKAPRLLLKLPKSIQTRENWLAVLATNPRMIIHAPVSYVTLDHYKKTLSQDSTFGLEMVPLQFRTYEICKIAVKRYSLNIQYVPYEIQIGHPDVCELAVEKMPRSIVDIPESVQLQNPNVCKLAVSSEPEMLRNIKPTVQRKYPDICRLAVAQTVMDYMSYYSQSLEDKKRAIYASIAPDVLKQYWDYINDIEHTITVDKRCRYR